LADKAHGD